MRHRAATHRLGHDPHNRSLRLLVSFSIYYMRLHDHHNPAQCRNVCLGRSAHPAYFCFAAYSGPIVLQSRIGSVVPFADMAGARKRSFRSAGKSSALPTDSLSQVGWASRGEAQYFSEECLASFHSAQPTALPRWLFFFSINREKIHYARHPVKK